MSPARGDLVIRGVAKRYGTVTALDGIDLRIPAGSLTSIVGPSGCGKSTLLRVLSGLEEPDQGTILLDGSDVHESALGSRGIAMVFQDYALYPHMSAAQNISFGLRLEARHTRGAGPSKSQIADRVDDVARLLQIEHVLDRRPAALSGGQRQRVALARAIIRRPPVLLLDEPLAALDAQLRNSARAEIMRLQRELGTTLVLVTHDQQEALSMSDLLVVMRDGAIVQSGRPDEVYRDPVDEFTGRFLGDPPMNVTTDLDGARIGWRPEDARIEAPGSTAGVLRLPAVVELCQFGGSAQVVTCRVGDERVLVLQPPGARWVTPGEDVVVLVDRVHRFASAVTA
jgi:multiple sugar transport system ATP-binding protein